MSRSTVGQEAGRWKLVTWIPILLALFFAMFPAQGDVLAEGEQVVEQVRFDQDGEWFRMRVETQSPYAHWTLADPPRIILDLGGCVSRLPNAPGLYEAPLDRGPIKSFRTSQFSNTPLDKRVRLTIELSEPAHYEAKRIGADVVIRIKNPGGSDRGSLLLTSAGLEQEGVLVASIGATPVIQSDRTDAPPAETPAPQRSTPASKPKETPAAPKQDSTPEVASPPTDDEGMKSLADALDEATDAAGGSITIEQLTRKSPKKSAASTPSTPERSRAQSAAQLLAKSIDAWLDGDTESALLTAERVTQFYANYPAGAQAALFHRQLALLANEPISMDEELGLPRLPDPEMIPLPAFEHFLDSHLAANDLAEVDRLLREWGSVYPRGDWFGRVHLVLGERYYLGREVERATYHLGEIPPGTPGEAEALLMLARLRDEAGQPEKALALYHRLASLDSGPHQLRGLVRSADLEFQAGQIEPARGLYQQVLSSHPPRDEEIWALYQTANCELLLEDVDRARESYQALVEKWPGAFWTDFGRERLDSLRWREELAEMTEAGGDR